MTYDDESVLIDRAAALKRLRPATYMRNVVVAQAENDVAEAAGTPTRQKRPLQELPLRVHELLAELLSLLV